jgi:hypothetical protein
MTKRLHTRAWERWKVFAKKFAAFQARLILTLFYVLLVPPFALIVKIFKDPLHMHESRRESFWVERTTPQVTSATARRQF